MRAGVEYCAAGQPNSISPVLYCDGVAGNIQALLAQFALSHSSWSAGQVFIQFGIENLQTGDWCP